MGLLAQTALAQSNVSLIPVAAPAYTPEQGFLIAGGGVLSWNGDPAQPELPRSSLTLIAGASTSGSLLLQSRLNAFTLGDSLRLVSNLDVRDQPDHYFGVGYTAGSTRPQGLTTTALRRTGWTFEPTLLTRLAPSLYAGVGLQLCGSAAREISEGVQQDPHFRRGGPLVVNTGVALSLQYDSRDVPINAWKGLLASVTWAAFGRALGATTAWHALTLDYRQYFTLVRPGSTVALQVKYRTAFGEVPWSELSMVGTPFDLRAYRWGQYRDRTSLTAVLEYRFMLPFPSQSLWSHLGAAAWVGLGALGGSLWPNLLEPLPAAGVGLRVELLRRVTVRLDVGFGQDSRAVYFNFLEAF